MRNCYINCNSPCSFTVCDFCIEADISALSDSLLSLSSCHGRRFIQRHDECPGPRVAHEKIWCFSFNGQHHRRHRGPVVTLLLYLKDPLKTHKNHTHSWISEISGSYFHPKILRKTNTLFMQMHAFITLSFSKLITHWTSGYHIWWCLNEPKTITVLYLLFESHTKYRYL